MIKEFIKAVAALEGDLIIAFDPALSTGLCVGTLEKPCMTVTLSIEVAKKQAKAGRYAIFWMFLFDLANALKGRKVYVATEDSTGFSKGKHAMRIKCGLLAFLQAWTVMLGWKYYEINPKTLKKYATGNGNADKEMMVKYAKKQGFSGESHDEADAFHIWLWVWREHVMPAIEANKNNEDFRKGKI
jgi:hypothetical protein